MLSEKEIQAIINKKLYQKPPEKWVANMRCTSRPKSIFCALTTVRVFCFLFDENKNNELYILFSARKFSELIDVNPRKISYSLQVLTEKKWLLADKSGKPFRYKINKDESPWDM